MLYRSTVVPDQQGREPGRVTLCPLATPEAISRALIELLPPRVLEQVTEALCLHEDGQPYLDDPLPQS